MSTPQFSRPVNPVSIESREALIAFLDQHKINYRDWEVRDTEEKVVTTCEQRIEELWNEVRDRDTLLTIARPGEGFFPGAIIRNIRTLTSRITHDEGAEGKMASVVLREYKMIVNGHEKRRFDDSSLSEKMRFGDSSETDESAIDALRRALFEELGIRVPRRYFGKDRFTFYPAYVRRLQTSGANLPSVNPPVVDLSTDEELELDERPCRRYPGLVTRNELVHTLWRMPRACFRPEGYQTPVYISEWEPAQQATMPEKELRRYHRKQSRQIEKTPGP